MTVETCGMSCRARELDILDMASVVWLTIAPAPVAIGSSNAATSTPARTHNPNIFNSTPLRTPAPIIKCPPGSTTDRRSKRPPGIRLTVHRPAGEHPVDDRNSGPIRHLLLCTASQFVDITSAVPADDAPNGPADPNTTTVTIGITTLGDQPSRSRGGEMTDPFLDSLATALAGQAATALGAAGKAALTKVRELIQRRSERDPETKAALEAAEQSADQPQITALAERLDQVCAEDAEFAEQLRAEGAEVHNAISAVKGGVVNLNHGQVKNLVQTREFNGNITFN
ncbi:hypothetical protein [Saccharopolyspora kobensis]|nr:hypothetical protein [Saccharopolyspora kobensis]